jgi:hypothetical protein
MKWHTYIDEYKEYHKDPQKYPGASFHKELPHIKSLMNEVKPKTILDFGCGKGKQYSALNLHLQLPKFEKLVLYDPAVPQFSKRPDKENFDLIYSTDVMEHIPEWDIPNIFDYIFKHAKSVYLAIHTGPAFAVLPNGENAHCTQKPIEWWEEKIKPYGVYTHLRCYGGESVGFKIINKL